MAWAWSQTTHNPTEKLILIALADYADGHGNAWPAIQTLCERTQLSRSSVYASLKSLEGQGLLAPEWITAERTQPVKSFRLSCVKPRPKTVQQADNPVRVADSAVQQMDKVVQQADEFVQELDCIYKEEPSLEPPLNQLLRRTDAEAAAEKPSRRDQAEAFRHVWNVNRGTLPQCRVMTAKLTAHIGSRLESHALRKLGLRIPDDYARLIQALAASEFHSGGGSRGWRADLEWLTRNDENTLKALEMADAADEHDDGAESFLPPPPPTPAQQEALEAEMRALRE